MKTIRISLRTAVAVMMLLNCATSEAEAQVRPALPASVAELVREIDRISSIPDEHDRAGAVEALWTGLKQSARIPFRSGDSVAFLYRGEAETVTWVGDFSGWRPDASLYAGRRAGPTDIWSCVQRFPPDARLDYKIIVDGKWILDPDNPYIQMSGMGPNSELRMPGWRFPDETMESPDVIKGELSENIPIASSTLGYTVQYRVYTPYNYMRCESLPVIYVTDGHEYADPEKGALVNVLDNLIFSGEIRPVIAVFIDPRDPANLRMNRRMKEYVCNESFAAFVSEELVPLIDKNYRTHACPDDRLILGTSLGGLNSAWFGASRIDDFHLLGINSPAFNEAVLDRFGKLDWYPFRIYLTTGVIHDTREPALKMKKILEDKKVDFVYREVNEGHSWGNWRALMADMLRYFFPN